MTRWARAYGGWLEWNYVGDQFQTYEYWVLKFYRRHYRRVERLSVARGTVQQTRTD
jgi:hypothetical protein